MRLCILCEDTHVENVRKRCTPFIKDSMKIGVSENGQDPITHWFCFMNVSEDIYDRIIGMKKYSIMESIPPSEFLKKWNMKIVK